MSRGSSKRKIGDHFGSDDTGALLEYFFEGRLLFLLIKVQQVSGRRMRKLLIGDEVVSVLGFVATIFVCFLQLKCE